jgi:hypothetical protein
MGYYFDHRYDISEGEYVGEGHLSRYGEDDLTSTTSSGVTINFVYDSRANAINPQRGAYAALMIRRNEELVGKYIHKQFFVSRRKKVHPLSTVFDRVLALRSYYWTVLHGQTPYLDLPATNWAPTTGIASRGFSNRTLQVKCNVVF